MHYKRLRTPIGSVEVLSRQTEVKYGTIRGGSTENFFRVCIKYITNPIKIP